MRTDKKRSLHRRVVALVVALAGTAVPASFEGALEAGMSGASDDLRPGGQVWAVRPLQRKLTGNWNQRCSSVSPGGGLGNLALRIAVRASSSCIRLPLDLMISRKAISPAGEIVKLTLTVPMLPKQVFKDNLPLRMSEALVASGCSFCRVPAGMHEVSWHNPPRRKLVIWLTGEVEFETSDGDVRRVAAGSVVFAEDTTGKGHTSRHPPEGQLLMFVDLE